MSWNVSTAELQAIALALYSSEPDNCLLEELALFRYSLEPYNCLLLRRHALLAVGIAGKRSA